MVLYIFEKKAFESNKLNFFQIKKFEKKFGKLLKKAWQIKNSMI